MNPSPNQSSRRYRSKLREEQAQETRDRILAATGRLLTRGLAGLSIPAIASEAGVSIATVYRNFRSKQELFEAIYPYAVRRARTGPLKPPTSLADLRDSVRIVFERLESIDDIDRAAIASPGADEIRRATMAARVEMGRQIAQAIAPELSRRDKEHLARLVIVLTMSATARMLRDHLGRSLDEAVEDVEWAVRAAIAGRAAKRRAG